jgi:uncharacterized coiled-coil protein SlyX
MKPRVYIIVVALLLAAIFALWPRMTDRPEPAEPKASSPTSERQSAVPGRSSPVLQPSKAETRGRALLAAPEVPAIEVTPETPPEPTVEWQVARQEAMLQALRRHVASSEAKLRATTDAALRQSLEQQIDTLKIELTHQQAVLSELQARR